MKTVDGVSLKASENALISNNPLKIAGCIANSVDPDQMLHSAVSDLGLLCLQRPICPNT